MAESSSSNQDDTVRPTFINSSREENRPNSTQRVKTCVYYQTGTCRYGDRCRFAHVIDPTVQEPPVRRPAQLPAKAGIGGDTMGNTVSYTNLNGNVPKGKSSHPPNWADAPEFVPRATVSYAGAVRMNNMVDPDYKNIAQQEQQPPFYSPYNGRRPTPLNKDELCANHMVGECYLEDSCPLVHGDKCDLCELMILNPYNPSQCKEHIEGCEKAMEQDMELSFAVQRSQDLSCGICLEVVLEKPLPERRFGVLDRCNHVFCLSCIRTWRQQRNADRDSDLDNALNPMVTRACPTCRIASDFVIPSRYWAESVNDKQKLIADYKSALSKKPCKYFKLGAGSCPFGGNCFYLHALGDGTKVELPVPEKRRRFNQNGESDIVDNHTLWEFLRYREERFLLYGESLFTESESDSDSDESYDIDLNHLILEARRTSQY